MVRLRVHAAAVLNAPDERLCRGGCALGGGVGMVLYICSRSLPVVHAGALGRRRDRGVRAPGVDVDLIGQRGRTGGVTLANRFAGRGPPSASSMACIAPRRFNRFDHTPRRAFLIAFRGRTRFCVTRRVPQWLGGGRRDVAFVARAGWAGGVGWRPRPLGNVFGSGGVSRALRGEAEKVGGAGCVRDLGVMRDFAIDYSAARRFPAGGGLMVTISRQGRGVDVI